MAVKGALRPILSILTACSWLSLILGLYSNWGSLLFSSLWNRSRRATCPGGSAWFNPRPEKKRTDGIFV